ncbi:Transport protein particle (TRAPP) component [Penicillium paradoxum]|uniref:Transport protein particle (TRAPP) component n=1 Tax=Penicillium paradoxum TaxID=176176 RepID=UPI0025477B39|nr:Transport protein particle (TRAPP) component [Penicillium paradoxum]KAJ5782398.1 Transport protein particle (TRAPP) component [Penicillium paradoxum]
MAVPTRRATMLSINNGGTQSGSDRPQTSQSQAQSLSQQSTGLRVPSNRKTIYDRHLNRTRSAELSRASFAFLFGEMVTYAQRRVTGIQDLEKRLNEQGYPLGLRLLDLLFYRSTSTSSSALSSSSTSSSPPNRPLRIITLLHLIHGPLWRLLFGRAADALEHSVSPDTPNEYMITDNDPMVNTYISAPRDMSMLNCAAYVAGIIEGVCDGCGFETKVSAHNQPTEMWPSRTVFLVRFGDPVMEREKVLERAGVK